MIYVRWRRDQSRRCRVFPPLAPDHPHAHVPCPSCGTAVGSVVPVQLIAVGPTDDEDRVRHEELRWYNAGAVVAHKGCVDALSESDVERLVSGLELVPMPEVSA